ncbi:uncharacterized protein LOC109728203 [Ananas comosus]|uniref:Uncharacterized protein LOC109728203 n=1 Tax=Ananas comosus TaxID=4615 RepID=A0A6P5H286_ANACO|nr:uncharacterized protein LOC109728203 [Ananas comosus]
MAKQSKPKKPENLGKGKVTPVQVAFIVDRYLADNNYAGALSAFRSEAADLFSKTKGKEVPKGLLGLGEILDEYICLKEQRVLVDQEKRRVETAMQGMQEVMRSYHSSINASLPSSPPLLPPQFVASTPTGPALPPLYPSNGSPSGNPINMTPVLSYPPMVSMVPHKGAEANNLPTPTVTSSLANKRKASKCAPKVPPAPKKSCTQASTDTSIKGRTLPSQMRYTCNSEEYREPTIQSRDSTHSITRSPIQGSSVAKSLFKKQPESQADSSPKTPPQMISSQSDQSITLKNTSVHTIDNGFSQEFASSKCSLISSETIIVSPLKSTGYYAVERSYHITSPFKPNLKKVGKREHVKGKLDFDESEAIANSEEPVTGKASTSSSEVETQEILDFDLSEFDILDGDFSFSELLIDLDLAGEVIPSSDKPSLNVDSVPGSEHNIEGRSVEMDRLLPDSSKSTITDALENINIPGPELSTSIRAITKRIKIVSPVKIRKKCPVEQID